MKCHSNISDIRDKQIDKQIDKQTNKQTKQCYFLSFFPGRFFFFFFFFDTHSNELKLTKQPKRSLLRRNSTARGAMSRDTNTRKLKQEKKGEKLENYF